MKGFLRFVGVANAGVWLGGSIFYLVAVAPAFASKDMVAVLGPNNFAYFSGAIAQVLLMRYFHLQLVCSAVALLHLFMEWLYLGRMVGRAWTYLLVGLFGLALVGTFVLGPRLSQSHRARHLIGVTPTQREAAAQSFRIWQAMHLGVNLLQLVGVATYFRRAVHPPDDLKFVVSPKIRS